MTERVSEHLGDFSGELPRGSSGDDSNEKFASSAELPADEASATARSRQVFYALADDYVTEPTGLNRNASTEPRLSAARFKEALNACGHGPPDDTTHAVMYACSKWAKTSAATLDLAEFQSAVERFSAPVRLRERLRSTTEKYSARRGLGWFVREVSGENVTYATADNEIAPTDDVSRAGSPSSNRRLIDQLPLFEDFEKILDGILDECYDDNKNLSTGLTPP